MAKILNFGSCNIDLVYTLDHITSVGEVVTAKDFNTYPGGKGLNLSVSVARAGGKVYHAGFVGSDGKEMLEVMERSGVDLSYAKTIDGSSGRAIIQVTLGAENSIFTYPGANHAFTKEYIDEVLSYFDSDDILITQNEINLIDYIIERAYEKGMCVMFSVAPANNSISHIDLNKVTYLHLNDKDAKILTGTDDPEAAIMYLLRSHPQLKILLTLNKNGCVYAEGSERIYHPAYKVNVVDVTGAGEVLGGYFISAIARGEEPYSAVKIGSAAAALSISKAGTSPAIPTRAEVIRSFEILRPERSDKESENRINLITGYIETHILDAKLEEISALLNYSTVYTSGLIKKLTGKTFSELLQDKRCAVSAKLLKETDMPIDQIIYSVGYENESFFRKIFKDKYGESPLKYRKNNR